MLLQPSLTAPHLPAHSSEALFGLQSSGSGSPHLFGVEAPHTLPVAQLPQSKKSPHLSGTLPQSSAAQLV
jgi:hypothetical protein